MMHNRANMRRSTTDLLAALGFIPEHYHSHSTNFADTVRKTCPTCLGTGGTRGHYDYARQRRINEFCERCDGYGYITLPAPSRPTDEHALPLTAACGAGSTPPPVGSAPSEDLSKAGSATCHRLALDRAMKRGVV